MPPLPSDSGDAARPANEPTAAELAAERAALRQSFDAIQAQLGTLTAENGELRRRLQLSEGAHRDLFAQTEHLVEVLAQSRHEVHDLKGRLGRDSTGG